MLAKMLTKYFILFVVGIVVVVKQLNTECEEENKFLAKLEEIDRKESLA
jgi:hypothetical protein